MKSMNSILKSEKTIKIVSYNILSPNLCSPDSYREPQYSEDHLSFDYRYPLIWKKFNEHLLSRSIICLQEVDSFSSGKFQLDFKKSGYDFYFQPYGSPFNGFMGVAIAVPTEYDVVDVNKVWLKEGKEWPRLNRRGVMGAEWIKYLTRGYVDLTGEVFRNWENMKNRKNFLICVSLDVGNGEIVHVNTVHMPCAFRHPSIMLTYTALVMKTVRDLAGDDAYVLAGDFNFMPSDICYQLITTGDADTEQFFDLDYPQEDQWRIRDLNLKPMRSSIGVYHGEEPAFTNYAQQIYGNEEPTEPFIGTLDYIFISDHLTPIDTFKNPDASTQLCPNAEEPSDHLLIWSKLKLD